MKAAVDGIYNHSFFGSAKSEQGYQRRLRAVVQNTLTEFKNNMHQKGQARVIVEEPAEYPTLPSGHVSRPAYINEVKHLMRRSRGCELPGTFNPLIIGELFAEQSLPWKDIAEATKNSIIHDVYKVTSVILSYIATKEIADSIFRFIGKGIDKLKGELNCKVTELLEPHCNGHPITFNHYLTDNVQKAQADRHKRSVEKMLGAFFMLNHIKEAGLACYDVDPSKLLTLLEKHTEVDMERYASEYVVDYMQAYYKVALKTFIDDVGILAIEQCLIRELPHLFTPEMVYDLTDEEVCGIVGESEETTAERARYVEKLAVLEAGLQDLKHLNSRRSSTVFLDSDLHEEENSDENQHQNDLVLADEEQPQSPKFAHPPPAPPEADDSVEQSRFVPIKKVVKKLKRSGIS